MELIREGIKLLNPNMVDSNGNTLLHALASGPASENKIRCLETVTEKLLIDPKLKNKQSRKAIDLCRNDKRRKILLELEKLSSNSKTDSGAKKGKNKRKKKKGKGQTVSKEFNENDAPVSENGQYDKGAGESKQYSLQNLRKNYASGISDKAERGPEHPTLPPYQEAKQAVKRLISEIDIPKSNILSQESASSLMIETQFNENEINNEDVKEMNCSKMPHEEHKSTESQVSSFSEDMKMDEQDEIDIECSMFDGLPWEVECTAEVWKTLEDKTLEPFIKRKIIGKIRMLANGDWRPELAVRLEGLSKEKRIRLFEAKLDKSSRILWEEAVAFSPRCNMDPKIRDRIGNNEKKIYTDIIRIWDIVFKHDTVSRVIERIVKSRERGLTCTIQKSLKGLKRDAVEVQQTGQRIPNIYFDTQEEKTELEAMTQDFNKVEKQELKGWQELFFPPASPNDREYHILKFYAFTTAMASSILKVTDQNFDFPFQVSELEHEVVNLGKDMKSAILLLGRSGTGKTTCCLYRLWKQFQGYWQIAVNAGPHIPRLLPANWIGQIPGEEESSMEHQPEVDEQHLRCGCKDICNCVLTSAKVLSGLEPNTKEYSEYEPSNVDEAQISCADGIIEDTNKNEQGQYEHLRQLFITKNPVLCDEVKKNFQRLSHACPAAAARVAFENEVLPDKLNDINPLAFPLFVNSKEWLLFLDASLPGEPFFAKDEEGHLLTPIPGWGESDTYLSFLPMLDSDDDEFDSDDEFETERTAEAISSIKSGEAQREITYNIFVPEIWPHMLKTLKRQDVNYHPSLVWTEIRSFIQGSVESLSTSSGYLSLEEYNDLGRKKAPNFCGDRNTIYDMFLIYRRLKIRNRYFDESDVVFNVYQRLRDVVIPDWAFHEIYVDETQDFTQAELFTLIRCCHSPNAMFFTGDTAQSIMRGVAFRFKDLKTLIRTTKQALEARKIKNQIGIPKEMHQLTHNYRSHRGILNLAASVIDILGHYFKDSFDRLERDIGLFDGPKPVILETNNFSDLAVLLRGSQRETSAIEFGAHQVVLVATEESKKNLPDELRHALILSIYEAKGLEFDDVLLYNFFKDSQAREEWRVITAYLNDKFEVVDLMEVDYKSSSTGLISRSEIDLEFKCRPLQFDPNKHKILNSELKQLYTALTRARVNVWIYDEDKTIRAPMFDYFRRRGLVDLVKLQDDSEMGNSVERMFAEESTEEDWNSRGLYFYRKKLWHVALQCYEKSQNQAMLDECCAHMQALKAYEMAIAWRERKIGTLKGIHTEYLKAAEMFLSCGLHDEAVICLRNSKEWISAGDLCRRLHRFGDAGKYYSKAGKIQESANCYKEAKDYFNAVDVMYRADKLKECIDLLTEYQKLVAENKAQGIRPPRSTLTVERLCIEAAEEYLHKKDVNSLQVVLRMLPFEEQLEFAKSKSLTDIMVGILVENQRSEEAAKILIEEERFIDAVKCTQEIETAAVCYLNNARLLFQKMLYDNETGFSEHSEVQEGALDSIEQCISILSSTKIGAGRDESLLADAFYIKSLLTNDADHLCKALELYTGAESVIGVFLCQLWLFDEDKKISESLLKNVCQVLALVNVLLLLRHPTTEEQEMVIDCANSFGFSASTNIGGLKQLKVVNKYKLFVIYSQLKVGSAVPFSHLGVSDTFRDVPGERSYMASLLLNRVFQFLVRAKGSLEREYRHSLPCTKFISGVSHSQETCNFQHIRPSRETFQRAAKPLLNLLWLDSTCRCFSEKIGNVEQRRMENHFSDLLRKMAKLGVMTENCDKLHELVLHHTRYLSTVGFKGNELSLVLRNINETVRDQIIWYLKTLADEKNEANLLSDVNLFLKLSVMSSLLGFSPPQSEIVVKALGEKIQKNVFERIPRSVGVFYGKDSNRLELFHEAYIRSLVSLYDKRSSIDATHFCLRVFFSRVIATYKSIPHPNFLNSMIILEFHLSLCLLGFCKVRLASNSRIYLPDFYIQSVIFSSSLYSLSHKQAYDAFSAISFVKATNLIVFRNQLKVIVDIISGEKSKKFDMFTVAFQAAESDRFEYFERFLLLLLVLIGNSYQLPIAETIKPLLANLRSKLNVFKLPVFKGKNIPERLLTAFEKIENAKSDKDFLTILDNLLKDSGTDFVECRWKQGMKRPWFESREQRKIPPRILRRGQSQIDAHGKKLQTGLKDAKKESSTGPPPLKLVASTSMGEERNEATTSSNDAGVTPLNPNVKLQESHPEEISVRDEFGEPCLPEEVAELDARDETEEESEMSVMNTVELESSAEGIAYQENENAAIIIQKWYRQIKALEDQRVKMRAAACKIQSWFRKIQSKNVKSEVVRLSEEKTESVNEKDQYINVDLHSGCRVCGISSFCEDKLKVHLSEASSHWENVDDYKNFKMYLDNSVHPCIVTAETLLEKVESLSDLGKISSRDAGVMSVDKKWQKVRLIMDEIFKQSQWKRKEELQGFQEELQRACTFLEKRISTAEQGSSKNNRGKSNKFGDDQVEDSFVQVTRKKRGRNFKHNSYRGRNKGNQGGKR